MDTANSANTVVIGAGISGLLSALVLAKAGHRVTVLERESEVGGVCRSYSVGPYKVDTGPHIITRLHGGPLRKLIDDYFESVPVFVPHGEYYVRTNDKMRPFPWTLKKFALFDLISKSDRIELIQTITSVFTQRALRMLDDDVSVHDVIRDRSLSPSTHEFIDTMCRFMTGAGMEQTPLTRFFDSQDYKNKREVQDPLDYLNGIKNAITKKGALDQQYPKGGVQTLINAILSSMPRDVVDIRTSYEARKIVVDNGSVTGVETDKGVFQADTVVYSPLVSKLPEYVDDLPDAYVDTLTSLETVRALTLWLGLDEPFFSTDGSEIWIDSDPPCWVVPTTNYDTSLAPRGHQLVGIATNLRPDADIEQVKRDLLSEVTDRLPGIEHHIKMTHWQVLVPEKAAWVVGRGMPACETPVEGLTSWGPTRCASRWA
ncbi:MAG TPA: NAD(P)/FAD-dependent oxidoreductase [Methanomicrobia archaeon]|nr:NAD(P)/FAD-dependent oxidoreductase [Methanomicrobia archaeon]